MLFGSFIVKNYSTYLIIENIIDIIDIEKKKFVIKYESMNFKSYYTIKVNIILMMTSLLII